MARLTEAYVRRRRWEQRALAVAVVTELGFTLGAEPAADGATKPTRWRRPIERVSPGEMAKMMGFNPN